MSIQERGYWHPATAVQLRHSPVTGAEEVSEVLSKRRAGVSPAFQAWQEQPLTEAEQARTERRRAVRIPVSAAVCIESPDRPTSVESANYPAPGCLGPSADLSEEDLKSWQNVAVSGSGSTVTIVDGKLALRAQPLQEYL